MSLKGAGLVNAGHEIESTVRKKLENIGSTLGSPLRILGLWFPLRSNVKVVSRDS